MPTNLSPERRMLRSKLANATRTGSAAEVADLKRQYRVMAAKDYIRELVDDWPPLTPEDLATLGALLSPKDAA